jgi:NodT family efflux transporter outer membrane factor (OMF) lipoprotein
MKNHHPRIPSSRACRGIRLAPASAECETILTKFLFKFSHPERSQQAKSKDQPPENSRHRETPFASRRPFPLSPFSFLLPLLLAACSVGPDYTGPPSPPGPVPTSYKESDAWKPANPRDDMIRGKWWEMYQDPQLNALEEQVDINNQNVLQAEAQFREAAAAVKVARAAFFPTVTTSPNYTLTHPETGGRGNGSGGSSTSSGSGSGGTGTGGGGSRGSVALSSAASLYDVPVNVSYIVDIWGAVRRNVEAQSATAQASFATLENARLSYHATLAEDYFELLGLDGEKELLEKTLASYQQFITLTKNRYASGIASQGDVAQAQAQYDATNVQLVDLGVARAQFEDAIAVLIGKPAPSFSVQYKPLRGLPPKIPAGVPSELLERRPDIAAAERQVASANATIGVNVAAYYPQLTLTGSAATEAIELSELFSGPTFLWSVGPTLAQTLFDAGKIHGQVQEAEAAYDDEVANYRQTVLTGFQQVEDNLSGLRILQEEAGAEEDAVKSAQQSLDVTVNLYQAGTEDYLNVITTQAVLLGDQVNAVNLRTREMTTSVLLVEALGGGWDTSRMPGRPGVSDVPPAQAQITKSRQ